MVLQNQIQMEILISQRQKLSGPLALELVFKSFETGRKGKKFKF
jgi:hypothetical protein